MVAVVGHRACTRDGLFLGQLTGLRFFSACDGETDFAGPCGGIAVWANFTTLEQQVRRALDRRTIDFAGLLALTSRSAFLECTRVAVVAAAISRAAGAILTSLNTETITASREAGAGHTNLVAGSTGAIGEAAGAILAGQVTRSIAAGRLANTGYA